MLRALPPKKNLAASLILFTAATISLPGDSIFQPGNLLVSRSVYAGTSSSVKVGQQLPPGCQSAPGGAAANCVSATNDGLYPTVFNNAFVDGSFGITSPIFLDEITPGGDVVKTIALPDSSASGDYLVTSFSSKSEIGLNLSTDRQALTFMGYVAPVNQVDVSNSNTPGVIDPTNPVGQSFYRAVARRDTAGNFTFTTTNAYSGNNGRAAILNNSNGSDFFYTSGNAGNGSNPQPLGVVIGAGSQIITPSTLPEDQQRPAAPTPVGSFIISQIDSTLKDKIGKDDNFRGLTIFNNVVYLSKGSGGNGVNTVYFIDTTGGHCTEKGSGGAGLPVAGATLPVKPIAYDPATVVKKGLPSNLCILAGFPATPNASNASPAYPFGLWFANKNTLYVADEGDGFASDATLYTHAQAQKTAGLQKWIFNSSLKRWQLAYTLQTGLNLGKPYTVAGYPAGNNAPNSNLPWAPATDGLRNITGQLNADGTVSLWAITSTVSGSGDQGADPNELVKITDVLANTDPAAARSESFVTLEAGKYGQVLRGVSFTPGTPVSNPAQIAYPVTSSGLTYNPFKKFYTGAISVRNNTAQAVTGPVYVQLQGLSSAIAVPGAVEVSGFKSIVIASSGVTIAPGATATATVIFSDPSNTPIAYHPVVVIQ